MEKIFTPGRTELAGNHTDHQNGRVLASAVNHGFFTLFEANGEKTINIKSDGFGLMQVRTDQLAVRPAEFGKPEALIRGILAAFGDLGLNVGGFNARVKSTLPPGLGLSSSAAFAVMLAKVFDRLFNNGELEPTVLARAAQTAENRHFGKPCGLMDQLTCALGQTVFIDFKTMSIESVHADFASMGLTLCLTDTGGSHAGLDTSYARIPADMVYIANLFGKGMLGDVDPEEFRSKGWDTSNRPVRRAKHFFDENERVVLMKRALNERNADEYIRLMNESGRSSEKYLNNIVTSATGDTRLQRGLELSASLLEGKGAWRVHGGGFAGCVQALMPSDLYPSYKAGMEAQFGPGHCRKLVLAAPEKL